MGTKIFTNQYDATETWSAQGATVIWGKGTETSDTLFPLLISGVNLNFSRRAQEVPAINKDKSGKRIRYRIYDAPTGVLQITSIFSPYARALKNFIQAVTKDCKQVNDQVWIDLSPYGTLTCAQGTDLTAGSVGQAFGKVRLLDVDLDQLGMNIQAGQGGGATIAMPLTFSFTDLDWDIS